ncbi:MAG: helix-turn-helix domain-containing protein [Verrucomicrobia bacterium]|nr:helix-turn-helix domain-containing protein [Verrucomicrobiota bacterium]
MADECVHLKLKTFVGRGESYHYARVELSTDNAAGYHDHDYHEVFWATRGRGEHVFNGARHPITAGEIYLIRPKDRHCVVGDQTAPLTIVNVAFPSRAWTEVRRRYFACEPDCFALEAEQRKWTADAATQARLAHWAERLAAPERPRVALDGFLMELPLLRREGAAVAEEPVPEWLTRARREIARQEHFSGGTPALAKVAGRSPSHVARATVRWLGVTPTDLVNRARMDFSAQQLTETGRPILEIALDCGLTNLSHFYALFRERYGVSPQKYRKRFRRIV